MSAPRIAAALLALVVLAAVVWTLAADRVVARAIERSGTEALGTRVTVGSLTLRLAEGSGRITGLRVAQPAGFGSGDAVAFGEIVLDLDVASLATGDPYVLELARVADPVVTYVVLEDGRSNLDALRASLARTGDADPAPSPSEQAGEPVRVRIDRLEIEGGRIHGDLSRAGLGARDAALPAIRLARVGGERGLPPERLAAVVGQRFVAHTIVAVTASGIGEVLQRGGRELRGLLDRLIR